MTDYQQTLTKNKQILLKALAHLDYSYHKIQQQKIALNSQDLEDLETLESFTARFSRIVYLFLMKYLRSYILYQDPGFNGSLRDFVNQAEKLQLIDDANQWMLLHELRNKTAHDYATEDLSDLLQQLLQNTPFLLHFLKKLFCCIDIATAVEI